MSLIVGGKHFETWSTTTLNWLDHGLQFVPGKGGCKRRNHAIPLDLAILHWTACEVTGERLFKVLADQDLGVEFGVDRAGVIYQYADPVEVDTWDAGKANARSYGVEIVNGAIGNIAAKDRVFQRTRVNGAELLVADFYAAQIIAVKELLETVNGALGIPMSVPRDRFGMLRQDVMPDAEFDAFKGVMGHYHVTAKKWDPGIQLFWDLEHAGIEWT